MKKCVIIGGAPINDYENTRRHIGDDDFVIVCDCGLKHLDGLKLEPSLIVGDFDSHKRPEIDVETIVLPREKDDTDTFFAVKEAVARGFDDFLLVGVIGKRIDHSLANLSILLYLDDLKLRARALDDYSSLEIVSRQVALVDDSHPFFSLLAIDGKAGGISIKNALFPLENGVISPDYQYGVSNEVLKGETAEIRVSSGRLLLVKVIKE
ncbi:MAG: thiamine diphosphokinase [Clostridia bacterium]|nr:thiamine diphosphokinase [Clostridia bacterium]